MNVPVFSILMPVFNVENYLRESLNSILNQEYSNWELIIVNDGSTDESRAICEEYADKDKRIRLINQKNSGPLLARRTGIHAAHGQYSVFLDSDDFWEKDCLKKLSNIIEHQKPDIIIYTGYLYTDGIRECMEVSFEEGFIEKFRIYEKIISSDELNAIWTKCIKTTLLQEDKTEYKHIGDSYGEDKLQFFFPLTNANSIYYLPEFLINYRQNPFSLIHNVNVSMIEKKLHLEVWDRLFYYAKKWNMWEQRHQIMIGTYFLKHMINTFSNVYTASNSADKNLCIMYPWNRMIPDFLSVSDCKKFLSLKERSKLFCMLHNSRLILLIKR